MKIVTLEWDPQKFFSLQRSTQNDTYIYTKENIASALR